MDSHIAEKSYEKYLYQLELSLCPSKFTVILLAIPISYASIRKT